MRLVALVLLCASISFAQFKAGDAIRVVTTTDCVNARSAPSLSSNVLRCEDAGNAGTIITGPTNADGMDFWYVRYLDGITGWSAGKYLELIPITPPAVDPPSGTLEVSSVTDGYVKVWYTAKGDSVAILSGYSNTGDVSGTLLFPSQTNAIITMTLVGPGGTKVLTASSVDGLPIPITLDSASIASAAYLAGRASVVCPPVDSLAIKLKQILLPYLK